MNLPQLLTFHCFNFQHYPGPNPYLNRSALVFDWVIFGHPLPLAAYPAAIARDCPGLELAPLENYVELFAQVLSWVSRLEAGLFCDRVAITTQQSRYRLALHCLDYRTSRGAVALTTEWLEALTQDQPFALAERLQSLQASFRRSVFGDPTVYALVQKAWEKQIPFGFLWDEGLMQYGYGKQQVRSLSTIFDRDSVLDSDLTTQKDDCKDFLEKNGFPVPQGKIVYAFDEALATVKAIGYPVAVKPVVGHEGIGVTAQVQDDEGLAFAYQNAIAAIAEGDSRILIEQSLIGSDFRLLTIGGQFVAAMERRPPFVIGDGLATVQTLIERENATLNRKDTPTSALAKILIDDSLNHCLAEQDLSLETVLAADRLIYLRKVANISSGGVSIDATPTIHPDNRQLAADISQYFRLVTLGIDIIASDLSRSWKEGNFGIIEINASPGLLMHLNPAIGQSIDVTEKIFKHLFPLPRPGRIPVITFNRLPTRAIARISEQILSQHPQAKIGIVNSEGIWINRSPKVFRKDYNANIQRLLRHPQLDLLVAEYSEPILLQDGMIYEGSDLLILEEPTAIELTLTRDVLPQGTILLKQDQKITVQTGKTTTNYEESSQLWRDLYLNAIASLLTRTDPPP